ncbi:MAG TPA: hypothetical protein VGL05_03325 [Kribbella sp.]
MSNQSYDEKVKDILDRVAKGHLSTEEATTLIAALKPAAGDTSAGGAGGGAAGGAGGATAREPVAEEGTQDVPHRSSTDWPAAEDLASPEVWADAVDSPTTNPTTVPTTEPTAESSTGPSTGAGVGPTVGSSTGPSAGPTAGSSTGSGAGQSAGSSTEPSTGPTAGQSAGPSTGPTAGQSAGPSTGPTAGQSAGPSAGPTAGQSAGPTSGTTGDGSAGSTAGPAAEPSAERDGATGPVSGTSGVQDSVVDEEAEPVEEEHSNVPIPSGVQRVTVRAIGRRVRLIGEPAVNGVAVDGPHVIKRDGDTLAISSEGDMGVSIDGFSMLRNPTDLKAHVNGLAKELSIRVNPNLQVEVEVTGGSVNAERLPGLTRVRVTAGTAKVADVDGPIDVLVQAGSANLDAQITKGRSRVRVESGTAQVALRRGSDVHVHTEAQLGRVTWSGAVSGQSKDVEIGRGRAALDVEVLVGTAQITSD